MELLQRLRDPFKVTPKDAAEAADEIERLQKENAAQMKYIEAERNIRAGYEDEIERLREENEKLLRNAKQDAEMMMAYNRICQKHGFAPSSSDLIAALQQTQPSHAKMSDDKGQR